MVHRCGHEALEQLSRGCVYSRIVGTDGDSRTPFEALLFMEDSLVNSSRDCSPSYTENPFLKKRCDVKHFLSLDTQMLPFECYSHPYFECWRFCNSHFTV
jgi:hypothetical protein